MPIIKGTVAAEGALVRVSIGWSSTSTRSLRAALKPIPPPVDTRALLDSGAAATCLDSSLVQTLAPPQAGMTLANLPATGGMTGGSLYEIRLTIIHPSGNAHSNLVVPDLIVLELPIGALGYQVLIGRDLLKRCRFFYDGPKDRFFLSY